MRTNWTICLMGLLLMGCSLDDVEVDKRTSSLSNQADQEGSTGSNQPGDPKSDDVEPTETDRVVADAGVISDEEIIAEFQEIEIPPDHYLAAVPLHYDGIRLIVERKCASCHNPDNPQKGYDLTVWESNKPDESNRQKWIRVVNSVFSEMMPPSFAEGLDEYEAAYFANWGVGGLPNDFEEIGDLPPILPPVQCNDTTIPDSSIKRLSKAQLTETLNFYFGRAFKEKISTHFNFVYSLLPDDSELSGNELGNAYEDVSPVHVEAQMILAKHVGNVMTSPTVRWDRVYPDCWPTREDYTPECLREFIATWGMRMFKRPLETEEIDRYQFIFDAQGDTIKGLRRLWAQWAFTPNFLYNLYDKSIQDVEDPKKHKLTAYERATQLSYALTGRGPSFDLLAKAADGTLDDDNAFLLEFDALLDSDASHEHFATFTREWLKLDGRMNRQQVHQNFDNVAPIYKNSVVTKTSVKPGLDYYDSPPASNNGVLQLLSNTIIRDHAFADYFTVPIDLVPEAIENSAFGRFFQTINNNAGTSGITDIDHRRGILTHLSTNMHEQNEVYSNPIFKGKFVLEQILCEDIGDFPISLGTPSNTAIPLRNEGNFKDENGQAVTTRQLVHEVTGPQNPSCYGCHVRMNGFGYAMGNYGSLGEFRERENIFDVSGDVYRLMGSAPLNTKATVILDGNPVEVDGPTELQAELATSPQVQNCYTKRILFQHMLGRKTNSSDQCFVESASQMVGNPNTTISDMLKAAFLSEKLKFKSVRGWE